MKTMKLLLPLAAIVPAVVTVHTAKPAKAQKKIVITGTHIPVVPTIAGNTDVNTGNP